jgi:hypothetical protein
MINEQENQETHVIEAWEEGQEDDSFGCFVVDFEL